MTESKESGLSRLVSTVGHWIAYDPWKLLAIATPSAWLVFGNGEQVGLVLNSMNLPPVLNPWIGLILVYSTSFLVVGRIARIWDRFYAWRRRKTEREPGKRNFMQY